MRQLAKLRVIVDEGQARGFGTHSAIFRVADVHHRRCSEGWADGVGFGFAAVSVAPRRISPALSLLETDHRMRRSAVSSGSRMITDDVLGRFDAPPANHQAGGRCGRNGVRS